MKHFYQVLTNTLITNVTTSYLWFALTFWIYLETKSVLATGIVGGTYILLISLFSISFGTFVDQHKKKAIFMTSSIVSTLSFAVATAIYLTSLSGQSMDVMSPLFWMFVAVILAGAIVASIRNIALSTTVTLLVPKNSRASANGLVGAVQGIAFILTSVFSGLSIGLLGMGWTLVIATFLMILATLHMIFVSIPEEGSTSGDEKHSEVKGLDIKGSIATIVAVPGLFALIIFSTFNNFVGGAYMALMDPYGLTLFSVEEWGILSGITGTGFIIGGLAVAKWGLGRKPVRMLLIFVIIMGIIGSLFTIREWQWLLVVGMWLYMVLIPVIEAVEQTVMQRVVPYRKQGRVFGFAQAFESAAAPITAFIIAPLAEFVIIPFAKSESGSIAIAPIVGEGDARGIALIFLGAGVLIVFVSLLAFTTKSYRALTETYRTS